MRTLKFLLLSSLLFSCNNKVQNELDLEEKNSTIFNSQSEKEINKNFGEKLIKEGYLKFVELSKADSLKNEILNSFRIYDEETFKFVHIDAEELAEFSFDFFIPRLNEILEKRSIKLNIITAKDYETSNTIFINTEEVKLYTIEELKSLIYLDVAARNFFKKTNEILLKNKINEQFYLLYDGNDLSTLLLTKTQFEIIKERFKNNKREMPYKP
jgi:hypothetical protein